MVACGWVGKGKKKHLNFEMYKDSEYLSSIHTKKKDISNVKLSTQLSSTQFISKVYHFIFCLSVVEIHFFQ